jgi:hypothetical protein
MNLEIYIQSNIFNKASAKSTLYKNNASNLFALDTAHNGLITKNLDKATIKALVAEHVKNVQPKNYSEALVPFDGGVYITFNKKYICSNCCGDISDIENWRNLLTAQNTHWEILWIGHPEIAYRFDDNFIYLSDYIDTTDIAIKFKFDKSEFINLLDLRIKQFDLFKEKVLEVIDESTEENYAALKTVLF